MPAAGAASSGQRAVAALRRLVDAAERAHCGLLKRSLTAYARLANVPGFVSALIGETVNEDGWQTELYKHDDYPADEPTAK